MLLICCGPARDNAQWYHAVSQANSTRMGSFVSISTVHCCSKTS